MRRSGALALTTACPLVAAVLASPAAGQSSEQRVIDRDGVNVGALHGVVVWEAPRGGRSALVRRFAGRVRAIPGARAGQWSDDLLSSGNFRGLDLGLDAGGRVVATYWVCGAKRCRGPFVVDVLRGGVRRLSMRVPRRCDSSGAAVWRKRIATTLRCTGGRRSGVYVLQGRRARLIRKTTAATAKYGTAIDLLGDTIVGITAHRVWTAAVHTSQCQAVVATLPSYANLELVQMTPGRVWWAHSTAADFGGSESEFGSATVDRNCSISEPQTLTTSPELDWSSGSFAVDGQTIFVAGRDTGGIVSALIG